MNLSNLVSDPTKLQTYGKYMSAEEAYDQLKQGAPITPVLIQMVASDPKYAYLYARDVIRGRFPEGEVVIATDLQYACLYACDVVEGRFPECEAAIVADPEYAYLYAYSVIKGRFPECETALKSTAYYRRKYAKLTGIVL